MDLFAIGTTTGQILTRAELDAESQSTYTFYVDVHDGKDDYGRVSTTSDAYIQVTITVNDVNEPPVVSGDETPEVIENVGQFVETHSADDPENSTTSKWTLDGNHKSAFEIDEFGTLSFLATPNYEDQSEYSVTVQNSDGVLTGELSVTVTVINFDERG
ncbi:MAG: cadherin domain-containing protein [Dehalococcoidia bacterium]|nr:cadherin domain-containing protein [Dehalococcoidia bacterium]